MKAHYGLKQAPSAWYAYIGSYVMKLGFTRSNADLNLYFKVVEAMPLISVLYVGLFLRGGERVILEWKYVVKLFERFGMVECKSMATMIEMNFKQLCGEAAGCDLANPFECQQLIGALRFLVNTILGICFVVNTLSQFMIEPLHAHWVAAKHVLRYLHGTINLGLRYTVGDVGLHGYTYADWSGNVVDRKSTLGCWFSVGSAMISWMSKKQKLVAFGMTEAEYITSSMARCEAV
eukprot:PITA_02187